MNARDRTIALAGGLALTLLLVAGVLYAVIAGRDIESLLPTLLGFTAPTIAALFTAAGVAGVRRQVEEVHKQVNGNYHRLANRNDELTQLLAAATGAQTPVVNDDDGADPAAGETPAAGGRHRLADYYAEDYVVPLDDDGLHLAADDTDTIDVEAVEAPLHASATERTVSGLVLPWDRLGSTTAGPLAIQRGGVRLPRDISRVKLHFKHTGTEGHRPVGYATGYRVEDDGLHMTFRVARTPDGDAAMLQVTEGVYNAFSAELAGIRRNGQNVVDSVMTGVALVDTPAFSDARVAEVHAQHTETGETPMNPADFIRALIAAGQTEAQARAAAVVQYGQGAVDAVTAADIAPAENTAPAAESATAPAAESAPATAAASFTPRPAVVPAGLGTPTTEAIHLSAHEAAETVARMVMGDTAGIAHAALADITNSAMVDATPPQWLGELWAGPAKTRRLIPLMNQRDLRSWRIQGFKWTQKPLVAEYAGDKTEIPTNPVSLAPYEAEAVRWAGGHDLDRKFFDFGDSEILESYWRAMHESYAVVTDQAAGAFLVANATAVGSAADLTRAMITASTAIDDAVHVAPSYYLANPADRLSLLDLTKNDLPAYLDIFGVDPRSIVWTSAVPAGRLIAGARPAATFYELPGSPLRVEAEHLSHGGRDRAMFGYTAFTLDNAAGLVSVTIGTGGGE